jgi:DNA polymerase-1
MNTMIVDSNFLCYRAKLTVGNLEYNGVSTGIMFGFFKQLLKAAQEVQPDRIVFTWDSKKSKRKKLLSTYKEKRRENQTEEEKQEWEEAFKQFHQLRKEILPSIGFHCNYIQTGVESDDLIAQYVLDSEDNIIHIVTADDDLLQLLDNAYIYNPAKNKQMSRREFVRKKEIEPSQWAEVKQIAGCKSDNVPGVEGVGEQTAIQYLLGRLKRSSKKYQKIIDSQELIQFNERLVKLPFEDTKPLKSKHNEFNMREFLYVCREFGLNSFRKDNVKEEIREYFK